MPRQFSRRNLGRAAALGAAGLAAVPAERVLAEVSGVSNATIDPIFRAFVERVGGVAIVGDPLTERFLRNGRSAQLFANFLLEHWPENAGTDYDVQPALLGELASGGRYFQQIAPFRSEATVEYIWQTRHSVRFGFLELWNRLGRTALLGLPISEEVPEAGGVTAQFFQRGKLSYFAARDVPIQIEPLGRIYLAALNDGLDAVYTVHPAQPQTPGASTSVQLTVKNTGDDTWAAGGARAVTVGLRWADSHNPSTRATPAPVSLSDDVASGGSVTTDIAVQMPAVPGPFRLQPDLRVGGEWFTALAVQAPLIDVPAHLAMPDIRVGLLDISHDNPGVNQATIFSTAGLVVRDEGGSVLANLDEHERVTIRRDIPNQKHVIDLPDGTRLQTIGRVLIDPIEGSLLRLEETAPQRTYRGSMEFAWLASYQSAWVVNTLPMDAYLSGLVEQNDNIPWEALRASAIAFRTYAYTVRGPRRASGALFDVAASTRHTPTLYTRDQVYHGYARELSGTRLRDAIRDTRGCVLTYEGRTIHAVYFSRADGRTRSWHEEWGGPIKPWAVAVDDPYSRGQTLLGHGIGLPLRSANAMAAAGANGEQILAAYYTGINFEHVY
ncbi:MAG: hypothetical protein OXR64_08255 [Chloroflexota bacterium]|nr:hypothetical protein [Chloroflexota bacterium]MDE2919822.1 hypothetical protein [Chloroflexota bacterium]